MRHRTSRELAVSSEHEILLAAAVVVVDMRAVTKRCMAANGSTWPVEQELWVVCSTTTAALGCSTPTGSTEAT